MLELTYHWEGDYLIPDLEPPEAPRIGKYGTMRHNYLRDYHRGVFDWMLFFVQDGYFKQATLS